MKNGLRQSMAWLHTWVGLGVGWILFFMFLTGTLGYFDTEIDRWMQPELPMEQASLVESVRIAEARLQQQAPAAERWFINPATNRDSPNLRIFWQDKPVGDEKRGATGNELLDIATGLPVTARETGGGQILYRMHYALHYLPLDLAYWIIGVCSMFMMVAIISGIIIHKKIFKDFFTFRRGRGQRSWLDMHNVLSVVALPFHIMITYSGLIFFAAVYMPLIVTSSYGFGEDTERVFFDELLAEENKLERANVSAPMAPLDSIIKVAEERWGKEQLRYIDVSHPGDANARVAIGSHLDSPLRSSAELVFDGVTGELLNNQAAFSSAPRAVRDTLLGLHEGLFAGPLLRWLYFLSGLLGTAMIATGMVLWTVKRRPQQLKQARGPDFGHRLVECLNLGTLVGVPAGIAAYFWANRLLPVDFMARSDWEVHALFGTWFAACLYPIIRPIMRAWVEELWFAAAAFALLPLVNFLTTDRHLGRSLVDQDWVFAGFDLTMLAVSLFLGVAAIKLRRRLPQAALNPAKPTDYRHPQQEAIQ